MRAPFHIGCVVACAFAFGATPALAQQNVTFLGTILDNCLITLGTGGTLALDASGQKITSANAVSGTATVITTSNRFDIEVVPPSSFGAAPAGGADNVSFETSLSATGVTTLTNLLNNVTQPLGVGLTILNLDLTATRTQGFPAGLYSATATLRCVAT